MAEETLIEAAYSLYGPLMASYTSSPLHALTPLPMPNESSFSSLSQKIRNLRQRLRQQTNRAMVDLSEPSNEVKQKGKARLPQFMLSTESSRRHSVFRAPSHETRSPVRNSIWVDQDRRRPITDPTSERKTAAMTSTEFYMPPDSDSGIIDKDENPESDIVFFNEGVDVNVDDSDSDNYENDDDFNVDSNFDTTSESSLIRKFSPATPTSLFSRYKLLVSTASTMKRRAFLSMTKRIHQSICSVSPNTTAENQRSVGIDSVVDRGTTSVFREVVAIVCAEIPVVPASSSTASYSSTQGSDEGSAQGSVERCPPFALSLSEIHELGCTVLIASTQPSFPAIGTQSLPKSDGVTVETGKSSAGEGEHRSKEVDEGKWKQGGGRGGLMLPEKVYTETSHTMLCCVSVLS